MVLISGLALGAVMGLDTWSSPVMQSGGQPQMAQVKAVDIYNRMTAVAKEIDTVFSFSFINKCEDGIPPLRKIFEEKGINVRINGKTNIGLGRPLFDAKSS